AGWARPAAGAAARDESGTAGLKAEPERTEKGGQETKRFLSAFFMPFVTQYYMAYNLMNLIFKYSVS
ncbi:MAG: hypothetical protein Q4E89_12080, partial [Eubacteriales bacterium]|nr:hypothetical protein [Eubacteriales bacterium]